MSGSERAQALLLQSRPVDLHADSLMWARWTGYDLRKQHSPPLPLAALGGHVDIPRLKAAHAAGQFFGLVSIPVATRGLLDMVLDQIRALEILTRETPALRKVETAGALLSAEREGAIGALLGVEGAHALEGNLDTLRILRARGVRYLGLLHFSANEAGFPAYGRNRNDQRGLTEWGADLVLLCQELGVIVDLAHINKRGFLDACALSQKPVYVSHTGVSGAYKHWRNIDDEALRAVAKVGGAVGIIFCPRYLGGPGLEHVVRHIVHTIQVAGEDTPALGSDWDGFIVPTRGLSSPLGLGSLVDALLAHGVSERVVGKILRHNALRVLAEVAP